MTENASRVTALVQGPDRPGIIAGITAFIFRNGGNIIYLDQHTDPGEGTFFMRVQFGLDAFGVAREDLDASFSELCGPLGQRCRLFYSDRRLRTAIMVSRDGHCLSDLLYRWRAGAIPMDIPVIVSNHPDLAKMAEYYGVTFHHLPIGARGKEEQEKRVLEVLRAADADTVVLARYMQILSPAFVDAYPEAIINIHHSFLPAFAGANPYLQAFRRGVKIIGATSHYVTTELDLGPIIAQDTVEVSHRDTVEDLKRKGQDIEKLVLARAVALHAEHRIIVHDGKTIVFGD